MRACALAPAGSESWTRVETNLTDQRITAVTSVRPTTALGDAGVAARLSADFVSDMVWVGVGPSGQIDVWTLSGGTWSSAPVASASTGLDASAQRRLVVTTVGTTLRVYFSDSAQGSDTLQITYALSSSGGGTTAGIYGDLSDPSAGNWPMFESFSVTNGPFEITTCCLTMASTSAAPVASFGSSKPTFK